MKTYKEICNILEKKELRKFYHKDLICTPISLIEEIVSKLPEQLFRNKDSKFFDPAMGRGAFLFVIKNKLMENGFSEQYVVENMLFGCDIYKENVGFARSILGGSNKYKCNLLTGDTLEMSKEIGSDGLGKLFGGMKFDCVVGNPPYQGPNTTTSTRTQQLYVKFVENAVKLAGVVAFIVPDSWQARKSRIHTVTEGRFLHLNDCTKSFDIAISTCYFIYSKNAPVSLAPELVPEYNLGQLWKRSSINNNDSRISQQGICMVTTVGEQNKSFPTTLIETTPDVFPGFFNWKVIVNNVGGVKNLGAVKVAPPNIGTSYSVIVFETDSELTATNLKKYLESRYVKFIVEKYKKTTPNSKSLFSQIPQVDLTRTWTDKELYQHFSLTQEEINLIENTIK